MADLKVKFGFAQIFNPTPQTATNIFRFFLYLGALNAIVVGGISEIPDHVKVIILKYTAEGVTLIHAITKLFGITISNDPTQQKP